MKHTSGKWVVQNPHYKTGVRVSKKITKGSAGKIHYQYASIADITKGEYDGEQDANAKLISLAPEMLEVLKKLQDVFKLHDSKTSGLGTLLGTLLNQKLNNLIDKVEEE